MARRCWAIVAAIALLAGLAPARAACTWPAWQAFKSRLVSADGRVIDRAGASGITTSEGQSYAMFFALVADDRATFAKLLTWTTNNLAAGDLAARLPAWKWGQAGNGKWQVLDANDASDADLWIAYDLLEAGRLWRVPAYTQLGTSLLWRSAASVTLVPGLGLALLPGAQGFVDAKGWRFNPSYLAPQLFARFALVDPVWGQLGAASDRLLEAASPHGLAPDWIGWTRAGQPVADPVDGSTGSYAAVRVYLWLGMLAPAARDRAALQAHFAPMAALVARLGHVPVKVDAATGAAQGEGPPGFAAALLPFLQARGTDAALAAVQKALATHPPAPDVYYDQVLALFGEGWMGHRYRFDADGRLLPAWPRACVR